jgi:striatin 1/3/4
VLNFLDKEFRKFQDKEESWELEKSELKSEISSLKEKNLKYENLQIDLLKRIKMLEFSLRNERNKNKSENDSGNSKTQIPSKFTQNQLKPVALPQSFQSKTSVASETLRKFFFIFLTFPLTDIFKNCLVLKFGL